MTSKENNNYGTRSKRQGATRKINNSGKLHKRKVYCVELDTVFESIIEASKATGANYSKIGMVCQGKRITAGGYHWEYYFKEAESNE